MADDYGPYEPEECPVAQAKISELPESEQLTGDELIEIVQDGENRKAASNSFRLSHENVPWDEVDGRPEPVGKTEAEEGTATTPRLWSALRVRQAIVAWWSGIFGTGANQVRSNYQNDERFRQQSEPVPFDDLSDVPVPATRWPSWGEVTSKPATVSQAEAEDGTNTTVRMWTAQRVRQAAEAAVSGGVPDGSVSTAKLKTTTSSVSYNSSGVQIYTLSGGAYSFIPQGLSNNSTTKQSFLLGRWGIDITNPSAGIEPGSGWSSSYANYLTIWRLITSGSITIRNRYVQSSPPYDHGDGTVHGYAYALIDSAGNIIATVVADDPPWYGNTEQSPVDQYVKEDGKLYGKFLMPSACCIEDVDAGRYTIEEFREKVLSGERYYEEEITTLTKMRGMEQLPHPFDSPEGHAVVLLDPVCNITHEIIHLKDVGESVGELFAKDYLRVDNTQIESRNGPPGVPIHAARWKSS